MVIPLERLMKIFHGNKKDYEIFCHKKDQEFPMHNFEKDCGCTIERHNIAACPRHHFVANKQINWLKQLKGQNNLRTGPRKKRGILNTVFMNTEGAAIRDCQSFDGQNGLLLSEIEYTASEMDNIRNYLHYFPSNNATRVLGAYNGHIYVKCKELKGRSKSRSQRNK